MNGGMCFYCSLRAECQACILIVGLTVEMSGENVEMLFKSKVKKCQATASYFKVKANL